MPLSSGLLCDALRNWQITRIPPSYLSLTCSGQKRFLGTGAPHEDPPQHLGVLPWRMGPHPTWALGSLTYVTLWGCGMEAKRGLLWGPLGGGLCRGLVLIGGTASTSQGPMPQSGSP